MSRLNFHIWRDRKRLSFCSMALDDDCVVHLISTHEQLPPVTMEKNLILIRLPNNATLSVAFGDPVSTDSLFWYYDLIFAAANSLIKKFNS